MNKSNSYLNNIGKKALSIVQFFLDNTLAFYVLVALFLFIAIAIRAHQAGISLFPKQTTISVESPHYHAGISYWEELDYANAEEQLLLALKETQESKGNASLETAEVMQKLGALYLEMDKVVECYDYLNGAYVTFQKKLGPNDGMTIIAKCQISLYDIQIGNTERGLANLTDAYNDTKSMAYKMQIATMLAQSHTKLGNYDMAGQYYKTLLQFYDEADISSLYSIIVWNDYAVMLLDQGEYQAALAAFDEAESRWTQSATASNRELANIYANKAQVYSLSNKPQEAITYIEKSLNIREELGSNESIYVANTYLTAASVYNLLGLEDKRLEALETALQIALSAQGENNLVTGTIYRSLGSYHFPHHNMQSAIDYHQKALEIQKNLLGEKSNVTGTAYQMLCQDYNAIGDYAKSIEYGLKAIEVCESLHKKDNPITAEAYIQIAWPYVNSDKYESALFYAELGADICDRHLESNDYTLCWAHQTLGQVYSKSAHYSEAFAHLQQALELYQNMPNANNSKEIAVTYQYLGVAYLNSGDYSNALKTFQLELAIVNQLSDSDKDSYIDLYNYTGLTLYQLHEYDEALNYYNEAEQYYKAKISASNPETSLSYYESLASVYNNIAAVYEDQEAYELATQYELQAYQILKDCSIDYREKPKIAERLKRLHQQVNPHISFEEWLEIGGLKVR